MNIYVGYIGVVVVTAVKEPWDDTASACGVDPAYEVAGFEYPAKSLLAAWRRAVKEIRRRGGVVVRPAPDPRTKMVVVAETTDIVPCVQGATETFDQAVECFDHKRYDLEDSLCKGWSAKAGHLAMTYKDEDGYTVDLRVMRASEHRAQLKRRGLYCGQF